MADASADLSSDFATKCGSRSPLYFINNADTIITRNQAVAKENALQTTQSYNSCCSTDLQGHPRSMIFISSEKACAISY